MALLEVKTEWAVYKDCFLQVARYQADNSRAIEIWNNEDGPIARITVCIAGSGLPFEVKDRISRSLEYDRERRNDRLWQKTLKTMAVRKEIMRNMKGM